MHCRIERVASREGPAVLMVSGSLQGQHVDALRDLLELDNGVVAIDLKDVLLVGREAVILLALSEHNGIELRNSPAYVRELVARERARGSEPSGLGTEASDDVEDK